MTPQMEETIGKQMRAMAFKEGHRKKLPQMPGAVSKKAERIETTRNVVAHLKSPSCAQVAKALKVSHMTAHSWLAEAKTAGVIEARGCNANRTYVVAEEKAE